MCAFFIIIIRMAQSGVEPLDLSTEVIEADVCVVYAKRVE